MAKMNRERALQDKRERKQQKKDERREAARSLGDTEESAGEHESGSSPRQ
jgi:hypothetical protein